MKRPYWLKKKIDFKACLKVKNILRSLSLRTVCEEALCPNLSECFSKKIATFLILGNICTRNCRFCALSKGMPKPLDILEPKRVAEAVKRLGLKYVVVTSVCRDDLEDRGVSQFIRTIEEIRKVSPNTIIETLIPDFSGDKNLIERLVKCRPSVVNHNIETVKRLYPFIRAKASYQKSLSLLKLVKDIDSRIYTKSGIILGLGEKDSEVREVFLDLRKANCDFLSIGQYLSPSSKHFPVKEYVDLKKFEDYRRQALSFGFKYVLSSPYTRSSFRASEYLNYYG